MFFYNYANLTDVHTKGSETPQTKQRGVTLTKFVT